jgi:hypothetical protein
MTAPDVAWEIRRLREEGIQLHPVEIDHTGDSTLLLTEEADAALVSAGSALERIAVAVERIASSFPLNPTTPENWRCSICSGGLIRQLYGWVHVCASQEPRSPEPRPTTNTGS